LKYWLGRDLCLCIELFIRLQPGILEPELKTFLNFIEAADDAYEHLRPGVHDNLNQKGLVLKSGPTKYTYQILETNVKVMRLGTEEWCPHPNSLYQYLTLYRPQLWLALDLDWYRKARERIEILTNAPPLDTLMKD
jgi:hypothetical protein